MSPAHGFCRIPWTCVGCWWYACRSRQSLGFICMACSKQLEWSTVIPGACQLLLPFCVPILRIGWSIDQAHSKGCSIWMEWGMSNRFWCLEVGFMSTSCLKVFDDICSMCMVCDTFNFCVGSVLEQCVDGQWHPVEFYSNIWTRQSRTTQRLSGSLLQLCSHCNGGAIS